MQSYSQALILITCIALSTAAFGQRVSIEKYDIATDTSCTFGVLSQDERTFEIRNQYAGLYDHYGQRILMEGPSTGAVYAMFNQIHNSPGSLKFGSYQSIMDDSNHDTYGSYNSMQQDGEGWQYGTYNGIFGSGTGLHFGTYNRVLAQGLRVYGTYNEITGDSPEKVGSYQNITTNVNAKVYGSQNRISGTGGGTHYGSYNSVTGIGSGTRCAGWFSASGGDQNYAAIFQNGDVEIRQPFGPPLFFADNSEDRIGIGTKTPSVCLEIRDELFNGSIVNIVNEHTGSLSDGLSIQTGSTTNPGATNQYILFRDGNGTLIAAITGDGSGGVNYATTSDMRLKDNIETYTTGLELVKDLQPRVYERISRPGVNEIGFLAQELQLVLPQAVSGDPDSPIDAPMMVDYSKITPVLVSAVQQLSEEVEEQRAHNKSLEERIAALEQLIADTDK